MWSNLDIFSVTCSLLTVIIAGIIVCNNEVENATHREIIMELTHKLGDLQDENEDLKAKITRAETIVDFTKTYLETLSEFVD